MAPRGAEFFRCLVDAGWHALGEVGRDRFPEPRTLLVTGAGQVIADSIQAIGSRGIACLTGVGHGSVVSAVATANIAAPAILKNNVVVGSVNANKRHWYKAANLLARADRAWLSRLITRREKPETFLQAIQRKPDDIKAAIQLSEI